MELPRAKHGLRREIEAKTTAQGLLLTRCKRCGSSPALMKWHSCNELLSEFTYRQDPQP